jgi:hypothetical protein
LKNDKTIVAYFVEYTVEKFEKFLLPLLRRFNPAEPVVEKSVIL